MSEAAKPSPPPSPPPYTRPNDDGDDRDNLDEYLNGFDPTLPCLSNDADSYGDPACGGLDCDDTNASIYPGAPELLCDDIDQNCNGPADDDKNTDNDALSYCNLDCNDNDPNNWNSCATCKDVDKDTWFVNCDAFLTINGPDCKDTDANTWDTCATCNDDDGDTYWETCNTYTGIHGPDCDDNDNTIHSRCPYKIGSDRRLTAADSDSRAPFLVWTTSEFGVSWLDMRDGNEEIYFARISSAGAKIGTDLRVTADPALCELPCLSWTGSAFGVSWNDKRDGNNEVYFARISASGAKIGSDLRVTENNEGSYVRSLSWTGSEFGVSWHDNRDGNYEIYFARISSTGVKIGGDLRITAAPAESRRPRLSWTGSEFGVSWYDNRDGNYEIYFARISSSGAKIGGDFRVTEAPADSYNPSIAWTGSEFGLSWYDNRDGNYEIYFARIGFTP